MYELPTTFYEPQSLFLELAVAQDQKVTPEDFVKYVTTFSGVTTTSGVQEEIGLDEKMRLLANRLIDLIIEDKEKGALRFVS